MTKFCVYIHSRPDGSPFYVGKGLRRRAFDFAPSRRKLHHKNIVNKYGRNNIQVRTFDCESEEHAFALEVEIIACFRSAGIPLVNITSGGEGASGHVANEAQQKALAKGRGVDHYLSLPEESKQRIIDGLARGREKLKEWKKSEAGKKHIDRLKQIGKENFKKLKEKNARTLVCADCGKEFVSSNLKAKCCSRACEQRQRRAREYQNRPPKEPYVCSLETRAKMSAAKKGKKQTPEQIAKRMAGMKRSRVNHAS